MLKHQKKLRHGKTLNGKILLFASSLLGMLFAISNSYAQIKYSSDFVVGETTQSQIIELAKANRCKWRVEDDYNIAGIKHVRIESDCFADLPKNVLVDLICEKNLHLSRKGVLHFSSSESAISKAKQALNAKYGNPHIDTKKESILVTQWDAGRNLVTFFVLPDKSFAYYESVQEGQGDGSALNKIKPVKNNLESILDFSENDPTGVSEAKSLIRKNFPDSYGVTKRKIIVAGKNKKTSSYMFHEGWNFNPVLSTHDLNSLRNTPTKNALRYIDDFKKSQLVELDSKAVCYKDEAKSIYRIRCLLEEGAFTSGIVSLKEQKIPAAQRNIPHEFMIMFLNDFYKKTGR